MATPKLPLRWDYHQVYRMYIPKMATQIPTILENALTQRERATQTSARLPPRDGVSRRGPIR